MNKPSSELIYFATLKTIATQFQTVEQLKCGSRRQYGLDPSESIEMAYEAIIEHAKNAIRGKRRPKQ